MDVLKYASPSDFDHTGAHAALMAELKRVEANNPQKELAKWAEESPQAHLERFSSSTILQRVMAESKTWARSVRQAIEGDSLTSERLYGFQGEVQRMLAGLSQEARKVGKPGGNRKQQKLKAKLKAAKRTIRQLQSSNDHLAATKAEMCEDYARQKADKSALEARLAELAKSVEVQPAPKPSKKRETPAWKPQHAFRQGAEKFLRRVEFGAGQLSLKLNKDEPVFRAPDLWKAMRAEKIQIFRQAEKTLNLYSSNVLNDQGYIMPPGRPKEVSGVSGVDFLVKCFRAGKKIAEHAEETLKTPPAAEAA